MYWTKKHVLICTASHCASKGANEVAGKLRLEMVRRGLDAEILVNNCGTIDLCDVGPNVVVYPDNVILRGVSTRDIPELIDYLRGGPVPERLVLNADSTEEQARRRFFAELSAGGEPVATSHAEELAAAEGFEATWIAEQLRRGFMARKPTSTGDEGYAVTKKALTRYGLP